MSINTMDLKDKERQSDLTWIRYWHRKAEDALATGNMPEHMKAAREFHTLAGEFLTRWGVDPRQEWL